MGIVELFRRIESEPSSNGKRDLLVNNISPLVKDIFYDTYEPSRNYYIKKIVIPQSLFDDCEETYNIDSDYDKFHEVLDKLSDRVISGDEGRSALVNIIRSFDSESQDILLRIVDRNLKIGVSGDRFGDIFGRDEDPYPVALAINLEKVKGVDVLDGTHYASRKLDGVRTLTFVTLDSNADVCDIVHRSRQNKTFTTLSNLSNDVRTFVLNLPKHYLVPYNVIVLDGECCIVDDNGMEHFDWIMREITRKNHTIESPKYRLFDVLSYDEFIGRKESAPFSVRAKILRDVYEHIGKDSLVEPLYQERITSQEQFDAWSNRVSERGWEGFMLRKDIPYVGGRTKYLIKVKKFLDAEYVVEDVTFDKMVYNDGGAKTYDVVASLVINHKGNRVEVGSGLSKEQRLSWFADPSLIIGKTITVQYFEETTNKNDDKLSLRFPVLKYVYEDGREV